MNHLQYSKTKISFAQPKLSLCPNTAARKKIRRFPNDFGPKRRAFSNNIVKKTSLRDGHFLPYKHARITPEQRVSSINQLERGVHAVNVGKARTMDW